MERKKRMEFGMIFSNSIVKYLFSVLLVLFFVQAQTVYCQNVNTKHQLAQEYYRTKDYTKAASLYAELYNKSKSKVFYNYYLKSLIELQQYSEAEKLVKKQIRAYRTDMRYHVDLGHLYKIQGGFDKSVKEYDFAIENVTLDHQKIVQLANAFISKREYDFAEKLYLKSSKKLSDFYSFSFEIANLYYYSRNFDKMIDVYLSILIKNVGYIQTVQNRLQNSIYNDIDNNLTDLLKTKLIDQIRKNPNKIVLNELLIWLYVQEKEFNSALIQVKALDKRNNEDGERLMALARLAGNNKNYKVAADAYKYVLNKGKGNYYYYEANGELLDLMFKQIVIEKEGDNIDIKELEQNYINTINDLGLYAVTALLIKNLAHLQAFYLNKPLEAIKNLEKIKKILNLSKGVQAECNLELADIYLLNNRVWDATMLYAEVELNNKNNPLGSMAKYKKSTLAYYIGDFLWAKAQLDVLKASTSKLIANDAFALSKLISNNSILGENDEALMLFAKAQLLHYQNQDSASILSLDTILNEYSGHPLLDEVYYFKAEIFEQQKNYELAAENYKRVFTSYGYDILADDALFKLAEIYETKLNEKDKAMQYYEELLLNYQESSYVVAARERFRLLRGDNVQ